MKKYNEFSPKTRLLVLFIVAVSLVSVVIYNEDNELLNFAQGFMGGLLSVFVIAEIVFFLTNRSKAD
ncbi:hypothetical protein [Pontibacter burrus]|uniref:Uncharacterized protein n=1 Tax=Pontibacter burrus TaxID=2704466 RepID=A0A6B3LN13_9BACT|nr:hypothetical protein [Pontibacter burrus]NEM98159.1 hypothetical protein [Pontibacter burrus]